MTRLTTRLTYNGQTDTINGWSIRLGISKSAIYQRLENGWTVDEVCANKRVNRCARRVKSTPSTPVNHQLELLKRMDVVLQREVTRTLRQFCRDLEAIVSRGVDRDFAKWPVDRSISVARGLPEIGNS